MEQLEKEYQSLKVKQMTSKATDKEIAFILFFEKNVLKQHLTLEDKEIAKQHATILLKQLNLKD